VQTVFQEYRNRVLQWRKRRAIERDWAARHQRVYAFNKTYHGVQITPGVKAEHVRIWNRLSRRLRLDTLQLCNALSGKQDPRIVPEEIFAADIDPCLNRQQWAPFLSHKSLCLRYFDESLFPQSHLHRMDGRYFDCKFAPLTEQAARESIQAIEYPVVFKPNTGTSGGKGVAFPKTPDELWECCEGAADCIVQRAIIQHPFFSQFNSHGLNTIRLYTYRSVRTDDVHVLNAALRMGRRGSLDNETAGGIVCYLNPNGELNSFALDKYACKFQSHPDTKIEFGTHLTVPCFAELKSLACRLADRVPFAHLVGWDFAMDESGNWRCIELNLAGHTIRFAQYAGVPFFGEFTDEVIDYCLQQRGIRAVVARPL
jgi:hypothetical protein